MPKIQVIIFKTMDKKSIASATGEQDPSRLTNRSIPQMLPLKQYDKLRCLILSYNLIDKIENLHHLPDLRELHLENNALTKLNNLDANKNLQLLNLANNRLEKIENISHLLKLETLLLDNNRLGKLSGLEYLKELKTLSVRHNAVESIDNLPAFSKLEVLLLSHNQIRQIGSNLFANSKALTALDLSHNLLDSTAFLQPLTSLQTLNLAHNQLKQLPLPLLPNLQSLNVSHNHLQALPAIALCFPELIALNIGSNLICSEHDILTALSQASYLTEFDFRDNPMYSETFESGLQKVHNFDFLNGKVMTRAGAKYYDQVALIHRDLAQNSEFYGEDDEKDRQIRMSGFYDEELEFKMSGTRLNRPTSPPRKKKPLEKATFYEDIDRGYHEFMENHRRIKLIREQYLKICGEYNIASSTHILTQLPLEQEKEEGRKREHEEKRKEERELGSVVSEQLLESEAELRKENEKNLNKWKELKQREKSFNIRDVLKKPRTREASASKVSSSTNWNPPTTTNPRKERSELFKTQAYPRKLNEELFKTMLRPSSVRRKE